MQELGNDRDDQDDEGERLKLPAGCCREFSILRIMIILTTRLLRSKLRG
jgi:hypothetical protein